MTIFINLTKVETTPFFIWGMYSEKEAEVGKYEILEVVVNDSIRVDYSASFTDANRFFLISPLAYSWQMEQNANIDPEESFLRKKTGKYFSYIDPFKKYLFNDLASQVAFKNWYKNYLQETLRIKVNDLQINVLELVYNPEGRPELIKKSPLALWIH